MLSTVHFDTEQQLQKSHTVDTNIQNHSTIPVSPPDTSTGSFKCSQITQLLDTEKKAQVALGRKKIALTAKGCCDQTVDYTKL